MNQVPTSVPSERRSGKPDENAADTSIESVSFFLLFIDAPQMLFDLLFDGELGSVPVLTCKCQGWERRDQRGQCGR